MHDKRFGGAVERLRSPERVELLEVQRVTDLLLENETIGTLLDVGTGSGLFAEAFSKRGWKVSGVDVKPEMLEAAQSFVPEGEFRVGLVEALPYQQDSFDLVFLGLVLHEADDTLAAMQSAFRVAKRSVGILEWPYRDGPIGPPLKDRLDPENLVILFQKAGFRKWKLTELSNTVFYKLEK